MRTPPPNAAPPRRRALLSECGQASADYAALVTLVAVVLAGAGAATGLAAGVPERVVAAVRTGVCIAGGDICRASDAAAAGLEPCITSEQARGGGFVLTVFSLRIGGDGEWTVAERSDGTVLVTRVDDRRAGVSGGLGFELGPVNVGIEGAADLTFAKGAAWELPDAAAAARLIRAVELGAPNPVPPTWRFGDAGGELSARAGVDALVELTGLEASAKSAVGARYGRGEQTIYVDAGLATATPFGDVTGSPPRGSSGSPAGGRAGPVLMALTRDGHGLRELAFRLVERGSRAGEVVEWVARLDLRDPANRAAVEPLLRQRLPWPPAVADDLRAALRRTAQAGTVERSTYDVHDGSHELAAAGRIGAELGIEATKLDVQRRLVGASAWTAGSPERRRVDCVGEG